MSRRKVLGALAGVLFFVSALTGIAPDVLDYFPFVPPYEYKPMPIETLPDLSPGHYNFGNYLVTQSRTIISGSRVSGNVTFYYSGSSWMLIPHVRILNEDDYLHEHPEDLAKLTEHLANFTDVGTCPMYQTTYACYRIGFRFTSEETTSYYFLFDTSFSKVTVELLEEQKVTPLVRMPLLWGILGVVVAVIAYIIGREGGP